MINSQTILIKKAIFQVENEEIKYLEEFPDVPFVSSEKYNASLAKLIDFERKRENSLLKLSYRQKAVALIVAITILFTMLTGCGIIFRDEIKEVFGDLFVSLTYNDNNNSNNEITDIYSLGYLPKGFYLKGNIINSSVAHYVYTNSFGDVIYFDQQPIKGTYYIVDSENGYSKINIIEDCEIYYRFTDKNHHYIWKDDKYTLKIKTNLEISNEEIILIIKGITIK